MFFYEKRNFGSETHFHYGENLDFSFPVHFHRCFEAICVLDGEIDLTVDDRSETAKRGEAANISFQTSCIPTIPAAIPAVSFLFLRRN